MRHDVNSDRTTPRTADRDPLTTGAASYEPPHLQDLGTVAEMTRGVNMLTTDGIAPGSALV